MAETGATRGIEGLKVRHRENASNFNHIALNLSGLVKEGSIIAVLTQWVLSDINGFHVRNGLRAYFEVVSEGARRFSRLLRTG